MTNSLLTFGAKSVKPEILEKTLTERKQTVDEIEKNCTIKTEKLTTCQSLIIAPRGSGKTHIIKVLYHRLKNNRNISDKLVIAYMSEDEVGINNFTDLMVSMIRSFVRYRVEGSEILEDQIIEASLIKDINKRAVFVKNIILNFVKKRIVLLLIENFDKILASLGIKGQRSLRDFIHQYNNLSIIATSQNLIANLQDSKSPFYNFFNIFQLQKLDFNETVKFLRAVAIMEGREELVKEIGKQEFVGKLKAIYELTEGNHRLLVTFYSFLKADFKSELSGIFIKVMNDLKPYYEQFINVLPPQQQKIVKHLSLNRRAIGGKEIAIACFIEPNVISKQLSLLFDRGMIDKTKSGKDVYYELKEPLMRICFEISDNPDDISKLFVDYLSAYYDKQLIKKKYIKYRYGAKFQDDEIKNKYENEARMYHLALSKPEQEKMSFAHPVFDEIENVTELDSIIQTSDKGTLKQIDLTYKDFIKGIELLDNNKYNEAIKSFQKVVDLNPKNDKAFNNMGIAFYYMGKYEEAIKNYQKVIDLNHEDDIAYNNLGVAFDEVGKYEEAIENYQKTIDLNPKKDKASYNLGVAFDEVSKSEEAIENYQKTIDPNPKKDKAFYNLGLAFDNMGNYKEAIENYQKAIDLNPKDDTAFVNLGNAFDDMSKTEEAIENYQKAIDLNPKNDKALYNLGLAFLKASEIDSAIEAFNAGLNLKPDNMNTAFSLLGVYIRANDPNKSKEMVTNLIKKVDNDLLTNTLSEDIFYNLFRFGSDAFIYSYFNFLIKLIFKAKRGKLLWKSLSESLFFILINIEEYETERLQNIEKNLNKILAEYEESIIPLKMFEIGVAYIKNKGKNEIFKLSKEERKLFKEAVLDKRELTNEGK